MPGESDYCLALIIIVVEPNTFPRWITVFEGIYYGLKKNKKKFKINLDIIKLVVYL